MSNETERCPRDGQSWEWHAYRDPLSNNRSNAEFVGCSWVPDSLVAPRANYGDVWAELTGYVQQARDDGDQIDPADLLVYLAELKRRALAPISEWMSS